MGRVLVFCCISLRQAPALPELTVQLRITLNQSLCPRILVIEEYFSKGHCSNEASPSSSDPSTYQKSCVVLLVVIGFGFFSRVE